MEQTMSNMVIVGIILGSFQFVLLLLMSLIAYTFKASLDNLHDLILDIKEQRKIDKSNGREDFDELFTRVRVVESEVNVIKKGCETHERV